MKTRIRDSYVPKLGDYCNTLVIDKETDNQYLFDADGVWTLISTDEEGIIVEAVAQANAYTDDVAEGKVDKEEGKGLSENDFTDGYKGKLDGIEDGAQANTIEVVKRNGVALPITDKAVDVAVPTTTSSLTNDSGYITNEVGDLVNYYDKDETDTLIATEAETRDAADLDLQGQIDAISSASDVVDVVGTYAELQDYDTSKLSDNDIIKVLTDETHDDAISYYRWNDTTNAFTYIGSQGPFYTKGETDATFVPQTRTINGKGLNSDVVLTAADVNALPASTVIPTVNDATLTIQKNGTTVATFTANSAQNATADISVPTKVSDLTNDLNFVEETDLADVAFSGAYADLTGTPYVPTKTSDLTNDSDFVSDANYVHTDNNFTTALKNKLNGIATGAEVNVQSDWDTTDTSSDAFIKNKPAIPTKTSDLTNDSGFITSAAVPTKTSDLTNDSGFITNQVNNLANYYDQTAINSMFNALDIPTKTSDLTNDSGFLTSIPIASATTLGGVKIGNGINVAADGTISAAVASLDWANITNKPTDVSYWTNDAGYITSADLPTKTSDLTNDSDFVTSADVPTKTSDLTNDSGFITNSVSNLANYYKKSETYTQGEVNSLLSAIVIPTKTSDLTNDSNFVSDTDYATASKGGVIKVGSGLSITNGVLSTTGGGVADAVEWSNVLNKPSDVSYWTNDAGYITSAALPTKTSDLTNDSGFLTSYTETDPIYSASPAASITDEDISSWNAKSDFSGSYNDLTDKPTIPTVNNATLTIQRNSTNVGTFTANASSNKTINITVPTNTSDLTNDSDFVEDANYVHTDNNYTTAEKSKLAGIAAGAEANVQSDWATSDATFDSYIKNKPTIGNGKITIKKNGTQLTAFTANQTANVEANIIVPTTVAELSDASTYVTQSNLATQLANKQNALTAGDHINITDSTIKAVDYVHSDDPVSTSQVTPVVTNDMIADGTITADKLASGATVKLTLSTSDIGEGAALAANTLYGVYQ